MCELGDSVLFQRTYMYMCMYIHVHVHVHTCTCTCTVRTEHVFALGKEEVVIHVDLHVSPYNNYCPSVG